jgi:hypothetical protein
MGFWVLSCPSLREIVAFWMFASVSASLAVIVKVCCPVSARSCWVGAASTVTGSLRASWSGAEALMVYDPASMSLKR